MKFEKGDMVSPAKGYVGNGNVFIIKHISLDEKYYQIEFFHKNDYINEDLPQNKSWKEDELELIETHKFLNEEYQASPFLNLNEIMTMIARRYERKIFLQRMNEGPKIDYPKDLNIDENCCKKEEKNMNKVLELYANRERFKIMNNYNIAMQNAKEEDTIQKLCKEFESQVKELAGDEANAYCFIYRLYTEETKLSFESIEKNKDIEMDKLNKKIEEIEALLDLAPDYDNKIKILRDYDIIDKKKNIML